MQCSMLTCSNLALLFAALANGRVIIRVDDSSEQTATYFALVLALRGMWVVLVMETCVYHQQNGSTLLFINSKVVFDAKY